MDKTGTNKDNNNLFNYDLIQSDSTKNHDILLINNTTLQFPELVRTK